MFSLRRIVTSTSIKGLLEFSSHGHSAPKGPIYAPKVTDKLIWINLSNEGSFERIPAYTGETLLQALNRFKVHNINGDCGGSEELFAMTEKMIDANTMGPFCNGCRVDIHEPWLGKLREKHYLEEKQIESSFYPSNEQTRLACCLVLEKWMDDLTITVPLNEETID